MANADTNADSAVRPDCPPIAIPACPSPHSAAAN
jgi:hypothetical protein